jgi:cytochrome c oxidase subunit 3
MATVTPTLKEPRSAYGGGGTHDRHPGGGGDDGRGDHDHDFGERLRRYRLAMAIGLVAVLMLFLTFTIAFVLHEKFGVFDARAGGYARNWHPVALPVGLLLFNTGLLILSSLTLEKARREAFREAAVAAAAIPGIRIGGDRNFPWLGSTVLLGIGFLVGQLIAWRDLMERGIYLSGTQSSSFFYVVTGMHAVHLLGGLLALFYAVAVVHRRRGFDRRRVTLDVTSWYWHSMTLLWVYILFLLVVVR